MNESTHSQSVNLHSWSDGAQFLSLEHLARMIISVILPILMLSTLSSAFSLWTGNDGASFVDNILSAGVTGSLVHSVAYSGVSLATALLVFSGLFWVLSARVKKKLPAARTIWIGWLIACRCIVCYL